MRSAEVAPRLRTSSLSGRMVESTTMELSINGVLSGHRNILGLSSYVVIVIVNEGGPLYVLGVISKLKIFSQAFRTDVTKHLPRVTFLLAEVPLIKDGRGQRPEARAFQKQERHRLYLHAASHRYQSISADTVALMASLTLVNKRYFPLSHGINLHNIYLNRSLT